MRCRVCIHSAELCSLQPWGFVCHHFRIHHLGGYGVRLCCRSVSGESSFCPAISPYGTSPSLISAWNPLQIPRASPSRSFSSFLHSFFNLCVLERSCKELRRTIRLITCTESAREHDHLRLADGLLKFSHRIPDILCIQVAEYFRDHLRPLPAQTRARCHTHSLFPGIQG